MRRELIYELWMDLYGPRDKININDPISRAEEELVLNPLIEYLSGVLIPRECNFMVKNKKEDDNDNLVPDDLDYDDEVLVTGSTSEVMEDDIIASPPTELDPNQKPSSFGISFNVNTDNPVLELCITWARYEIHEKNDEKIYKRLPYGKILTLNIRNENLKYESIYEDGNDSILIYYKKSRNIHTNENMVIIYLVNNLSCKSKNNDVLVKYCIFQPQFRIRGKESTKIEKSSYKNETILQLVYKNRKVLGRGYLCSAIWKEIDYLNPKINSGIDPKILWPDAYYLDKKINEKIYEKYLECDIRSDFLPLFPIISPNYFPKFLEDHKSSFSAKKISETWNNDSMEIILRPIEEKYREWIDINETALKTLNSNSDELNKYTEIIKHERETLERIKIGINLILENELVKLAFCFANRSVYLSNFWFSERKRELFWRPFQIAFFLMTIESIVNPESKRRDIVDLLWIPTGGGKTEAYLAIMCFNIAYRRLKVCFNEDPSHNGGGVSVITRYTLRLLTIQQFRRTMGTILAADYLRIQKMANNMIGWRPIGAFGNIDLLYGSVRFSIGLWVGSAVTQNHLRAEWDSAIRTLQNKDYPNKSEPAQIIECPVCKKSWLSIPKRGLPPQKENSIYWIFRFQSGTVSEIVTGNFKNLIDTVSIKYNIFTINHPQNYFTLQVTLESNTSIKEESIHSIFEEIFKTLSKFFTNLELCQMRCSRPGYFGILCEPQRSKFEYIDFEIYCPNPDCDLNNVIEYIDGIPKQINGANKLNTKFDLYQAKKRNKIAKFKRMPISAYTVDDQIYGNCPTVIVSTADKFARLSFEPRCGNIFGNVNQYNPYYGYTRYDRFPKESLKSVMNETIEILPFAPPDLIIQDELHLMEGPLGSVFGLYEIAINSLIIQRGYQPKYIASTATIKNAENQVNLLFAKEVNQFPPFGLDIEDSFFVGMETKKQWAKNQPGRLYMGVYIPGKGPQLPNLRIWASLLQGVEERKSLTEFIPEIRNFWTLVGYFNTLHGLGNARAILRDDVIDRINQINEFALNTRELSHDKIRELSSLIDSTDISEVLKELEEGSSIQNVEENPDVILSTSMFGTGVDISHLSLMTIQAQPKSTAQYIQATGRVGRTHGGLIIVQYRASRPRDQSHYELFSGYHSRIYLEVEPISVSPYSKTALIKAGGPVIIAFLRNMWNPTLQWYLDESPTNFNDSNHNPDFNTFINHLRKRLNNINSYFNPNYLGRLAIDELIDTFKAIFDKWQKATQTGRYRFWQFIPAFLKNKIDPCNVVLGDPFHQKLGHHIKVVYKNAPQSLREVDEVIGLKRSY